VNWLLPAARRRTVQPELMMSMRMGPAICVATWAFAALDHVTGLLL
jgi:hypothetical protein